MLGLKLSHVSKRGHRYGYWGIGFCQIAISTIYLILPVFMLNVIMSEHVCNKWRKDVTETIISYLVCMQRETIFWTKSQINTAFISSCRLMGYKSFLRVLYAVILLHYDRNLAHTFVGWKPQKSSPSVIVPDHMRTYWLIMWHNY